ncbi:MAG: bifunctional homocysteine S-methyltransferase/methylenetetrahydrofolate reductase [Ktedonobacterales bacterium]
MSEPVIDRLRQRPLLCDGAMGTMLYARAAERLSPRRCFDEVNLSDPELVQTIHREYILAGAQMIETNTFGANRAKLGAYGLDDQMRAINIQAAKLAREAREVAGRTVFVAGAVGPSGQLIPPAITTTAIAERGAASADEETRLTTLRGIFREQIEALMEGGVDLILLETFPSLAELREAALAAREAGSLPLIAQITFSEDGQTLSGETPAEVARALAGLRVNAIGVNCSMGPAGILDAVQEMAETLRAQGVSLKDDLFLTAQPNAGLPARIENRFLYVSTPRYFADYARRFADAGCRLIGGCCGTTPAHIAAMAETLAEVAPLGGATLWPVTTDTIHITDITGGDAAAQAGGDAGARTRWQEELATGRFAVSVELDPPKGLNPQKILDGAAFVREMGVQFINIADSPMARVRMSCLALARLLHDQLDLEAIVHVTTRDRNLMALQSDLLGAHALGIHNVLALTGDPVRAGNYPNLTGVWDVDSVGLLRILRGLNEGRDAAGAPLGMPAHFYCGAALNLNMEDRQIDVAGERERSKLRELSDVLALAGIAEDAGLTDATAEEMSNGLEHQHPYLTETELELHRLRHKLAAGAQYIMTQPIYELAPLERFYAAFGPVDVPVILGMVPLHSYKHAEYLHNEVPGISIPDEVRAHLREAGDRGREVGIELAYEIVSQARARGLIQGCYLMPSYGRYDLVGELARELLRG